MECVHSHTSDASNLVTRQEDNTPVSSTGKLQEFEKENFRTYDNSENCLLY